VNAIYFKGKWASKFHAACTQKKTFYVAQGNEKQVVGKYTNFDKIEYF
jgi:serine protease inhibitor